MGRLVRSHIQDIKKDLKEISADLPEGMGFELKVVEDAGAELEEMIGEILKLAMAGAVLAMIVLLIFVRNWRIAAVVALSIPASIIINFNVMYAFGLSINLLTLLGLAAGVGMLIDNSIVVVENVFRHAQRSHGAKSPEGMQAIAWSGSREIGWAIMMSTVTTLAVFTPMAFFQDNMVIVLREMALSFVFPLAVSLLVALTLIPMLASKVLSARAVAAMQKQAESQDASSSARGLFKRPGRPPRNILRELILYCTRGSLRHPIRLSFILIAMMLGTLFVAIIKLAIQGGGNLAMMQTTRLTLYAKPRLNSSLDDVDLLFQQKEEQIAQELDNQQRKNNVFFDSFSSNFNEDGGQIDLKVAKEYQQYPVQMFESGFKFLEEKTAAGEFQLKPFREVSQQAMIAQQSSMMGSQNIDYVVLTGENIDGMRQAAELLKEELEQNELIETVEIEAAEGSKEIHFEPDLELVQLLQANLQSISSFFSARNAQGTLTDLELDEAQVRRRVTVLVKEDKQEEEEGKVKQTLTELKQMQVPVQNGGVTPLNNLGVFSPHNPAPEITKTNRQRQLRVSFSLQGAYYNSDMQRDRQNVLREIQTTNINNRRAAGLARLPAGVSAHIAGTLEEAESSATIWKNLFWLAILSLYLVMAFLFNSLTTPLIVLVTIPLACVGSVWGVIAFNAPLDMVAMLGSIILIGLVVNNGILLIEYTRQLERQRGFRRTRALMTAVSFRFRPILMTSMTTVLGLLPILLSKEAEAQTRSLVAVLAGGIVVSALLTLVAIPTFYNVFALWTETLSEWKKFTLNKLQLALGLRLKPIDLPFGAAPTFATPGIAAPASVLTIAAPASTGEAEQPPSPGAAPVTLNVPPPLPGAPPAAAVITAKPTVIEPDDEQTPNTPLSATLPTPPDSETVLNIEIDNISRIYGGFSKEALKRTLPLGPHPYGHRPLMGAWALRNVSLTIEPGMFGLLGPNGAGKTTLMKILTGIIPPTTGTITIGGLDLQTNRKEIRQFISYLPQHSGVNQALTLNQYLNFCAPHYGLNKLAERRRAVDQAITGVGLQHVRDLPMKRFSGGMRQRAVIAQFLLRPQPILIVDEPTAGLDPVERVRFRLLLSQLARTRIVILSTHIVDDITSSCKRVAVLHRGQVVYCGGLEQIVEDAKEQIWNIVLPADQPLDAPAKSILYRHHVEGGVQYRFFAFEAPPGANPVDPTFEDAYVALLLRKDVKPSSVEPG